MCLVENFSGHTELDMEGEKYNNKLYWTLILNETIEMYNTAFGMYDRNSLLINYVCVFLSVEYFNIFSDILLLPPFSTSCLSWPGNIDTE